MTVIKIRAMDNVAKSEKYPPSPKQWQAISLTGANILVAAAAGSGKTEVLSERIARKVVIDKWNINEVLVLTFTKAASKEMLERIEEKIEKKLSDINTDESAEILKNQRLLLGESLVTTIDSFCANILRKFYYLVEENVDGKLRYLSPNFKILENNTRLLKSTLNSVVNKLYDKNKEGLDILFEIFSDKGSISSALQDVYIKTLSIPNYKEYIKKDLFKNIVSKDYSSLLGYLDNLTYDNYQECLGQVADELSKVGKSKPKFTERELLKDLSVDRQSFLDNVLANLHSEELINTSFDNHFVLSETIEYLLGNIEGELKVDVYEKLLDLKAYFLAKTSLYKFVEVFRDALLMLDNDFILEKRKSGYLDFSDLSHLAINALEKIEDGKSDGTEASTYYKNLFKEIYVDEYQDNNDLQEYILNLVKGDETNFFRVGDVKQSIYGFRGSNPDLFEEKYQSFTNISSLVDDNSYDINEEYNLDIDDDTRGICIVLKENFRSYDNVLKTSNFVFNRLMGNGGAGVSYDKEAALYYPKSKKDLELAKNEEPPLIPTKLVYMEKGKTATNEDIAESIASEIKKLNSQGVSFKSFAILLRATKAMQTYRDVLVDKGLPVYFKERKGMTESYAFNILFNLLKFLDNRLRESSLLVLLKTIFSFSDDDLVSLAREEGDGLYQKLEKSELGKSKFAINLLRRWFSYSYNNAAYDIVMEVANDINLYEYLSSLDIEDSEIDYYENFLNIVRNSSKDNSNLPYTIKILRAIKEEALYESNRKVPENSVLISTIHNSKGLQYDYVFLADVESEFNDRDYRSKIIFSRDLHLSVDESLFYSNSQNYHYKLNSKLLHKKIVEEEIRNLYVALTRAVKGLYICSKEKIYLEEITDEKKNKSGDKSILGLLQKAFVKFEDISDDLTEVGALVEHQEYQKEDALASDEKKDKREDENKQEDYNLETSRVVEISKGLNKELVEKSYYPLKTSYSALKKINSKPQDKGQEYLRYSNYKENITANKAILIGNLIHKLFEKIVKDVRQGQVIEDIDLYLYNLKLTGDTLINIKENRILTEEDYKLINTKKDRELIYNFINGPLIEYIKNAQKVETELAFTSPKKVGEIYTNAADRESEEVILQGVIDLLIKVDEKTYMLVDYKTDRVAKKDGEKVIKHRHKDQLDLYSEAVSKYYGADIEVKKYVYSYFLSKLIDL